MEFRPTVGAGDAAVRSGRPVFLDEVAGEAQGASVRVVGDVVSVDIEGPSCVITHRGHGLVVNLGLVRETRFAGLKCGARFLFIGELGRDESDRPWLDARIARCVDGTDMELYERAVLQVRAFQATVADELSLLEADIESQIGDDDFERG
jgi:hypothetical protein